MGTSIDGRLHPSRFTSPASGISADILHSHYEQVHDQFDADGWIVGRRTMSELSKGTERAVKDAPRISREAHVGARNGRKLAIGIDRSGRVHYGKDNIGGDHVVAVWESRFPMRISQSCARTACPTYSPVPGATIWPAPSKRSLRCSA